MKKLALLYLILVTIFNCEEVIDVEVDDAQSRLVIEASINWYKNTLGNEQSIKLSLTAPFFDQIIPPANNASVQITDTNNNTFNFIEDSSTGIYLNNDFIPAIGETYQLTIVYNGETFTASETLMSVSKIDFIEQNDEGGFTGDNIELKAFFTDPENEENFYLSEFIANIPITPDLDVYRDEFINGNQTFAFYTEEDLVSGDIVTIRNYGISENFYNYLFILLEQTDENSGDPFEVQPTALRGNCINTTNPDNYPFGYFRASEVDELIYTVE